MDEHVKYQMFVLDLRGKIFLFIQIQLTEKY